MDGLRASDRPLPQVVDLTACLSEAESMSEVLIESLADLKTAAKEEAWQPLVGLGMRYSARGYLVLSLQ
jgi:hypothetical protein